MRISQGNCIGGGDIPMMVLKNVRSLLKKYSSEVKNRKYEQ